MTVTALRPADDVVGMLRKLADDIEAKRVEASHVIVVVPTGGVPMLFGFGPEWMVSDKPAVYYELALAMKWLMEEG